MAQPSQRALPAHLQPRPKAAPASSGSSSTSPSAPSLGTPPLSRSSSRHPPSPYHVPAAADASTHATIAFVRRVLCPLSTDSSSPPPLSEQLPPLTTRNDVDLQLYAIAAVVMKEFVYSWYGKITPDRTFVEEVVRILAHCTRELEQRARRLDWERLLGDEVAGIIHGHVLAYRASHFPLHRPPIVSSSRTVYHAMVPHPALSPVPDPFVPASTGEQATNEAAYRQLLVQGVLALLLPAEDLRNPCLRILVTDVIGDMILGNGVSGKACEGWAIWEGITKVINSTGAKAPAKNPEEDVPVDGRSRLERSGLLKEAHVEETAERRGSVLSTLFWQLMLCCYHVYLTVSALRSVMSGLIAASSLPPRSRSGAAASSTPPKAEGPPSPSPMASRTEPPTCGRPILSYAIFSMVAQLLSVERRMPWTSGAVSLLRHHLMSDALHVGDADGVLDKYLQSLIRTFLNADLVSPALLAVRVALFPGNSLALPRAMPDAAEQRFIKRQAALAILGCVPDPVARRFFSVGSRHRGTVQPGLFTIVRDVVPGALARPYSAGSGEPYGGLELGDAAGTREKGPEESDPAREFMLLEVEAILDIFGDPYCNKHLVYQILDLLVVRLMPELAEKRVGELLVERIGMEA